MAEEISEFLVYGLIVVQVTSAFLVLWFDCGASQKRVHCCASHEYFLGFVWFDCCASHKCLFGCGVSHKRVLSFMVFTVAQVTCAFLFLWFNCCASHKRFLVFMV